jgi:hypothetical protein
VKAVRDDALVLRVFPMTEKPSVNLTGVVERIIQPILPNEPEKAQIAVEKADNLYREIRIDNNFTDADGEAVRLKQGAEVKVVISADPEDTDKL